ncbi:MAG TPA: deoxynucleoside kinase [Spirochaetia bacterium]|nr:deoxynucleoside kinase [Spirochaetia bacterium]
MANKLIALEGQIGAGKTTLGLILAESLKVPFYAELAAENTELLLDKFYADRSRWAFTMQTHFITHRAAMLSAMPQGTGGILDRSLSGDRIFAEVLHEDGYMDDLEFSAYEELFELLSSLVPPPDLMVYLDCNVDVALDRIRRRNRPAEAGIPRRYLDHLDRRYRSWYASYSRSPKLRIPFDEMAIDEPGVAASLVEMIREAAHADGP